MRKWIFVDVIFLIYCITLSNEYKIGFIKSAFDDTNLINITKTHIAFANSVAHLGTDVEYAEYNDEGAKESIKSEDPNAPTEFVCNCDPEKMDQYIEMVNNTNKMIWCLTPFAPYRCNRSFLPASYIMASKYAAVAFIGGNKVVDEYYIPRFEALAKNLGQHMLKPLEQSEVTTTSISEYVDNIKKYESCIIYTTLKNEGFLDDLLTALGSTEHNKYTVMFLLGGLYEDKIEDRKAKIEGYYIEKIYNKDDVNNTFLNIYKSYTNNVLMSHTISEEMLIMAYINSLVHIRTFVNSDETVNLVSQAFGKEVEYAGGEIAFLPAQSTTVTTYIYRFTDTSGTEKLDHILPNSQSIEPNYIHGKVLQETCNFVKNSETGINRNEPVVLFQIADVNSEDKRDSSVYNRIFLDYLIERVNDGNGVLGSLISVLYINYYNNTQIVEEIIDNYELYHPSAIIIDVLPQIRDYIVKNTEFLGDDLVYFYMGYNEGGYCNKHIISASNVNNDILLPLRSFARDKGYKKMVLLGSDGNYGESSYSKMFENMKSHGISSDDILGKKLTNNTKEYCDDVVNSIYRFFPDGGLIYSVAEKNYTECIIKSIHSHPNISFSEYSFISSTLDELQMKNIGWEYVEDIYYLTYYWNGSEHQTLEDFRKYYSSLMNDEYPTVNSLALYYNIIYTWIYAMTLSASTEASNYLTYLFHQTLDTLAIKPYEIYTNGMGQCVLSILRIKDKQSIYVSNSMFAQEAKVFNNGTFYCNLNNDPPISQSIFYTVGVLFAINDPEGLKRLDEIDLIINLVNQDGGINGRLLVTNFTNYDGNPEHIVESAKQLVFDKNLLCFIGGRTREERDALDDWLIEVDKLMFSIYPSTAEVNYRNIIQVAAIPNTLLNDQLIISLDRCDVITILAMNQSIQHEYLEYVNNVTTFYGLKMNDIITFTNKTLEIEDFYPILSAVNDSFNQSQDKRKCVISLVGDNTDNMIQAFADNYTIDDWRFLIFDFSITYYLNSKNGSNYDSHFIGTSYYSLNSFTANIVMRNNIDNYKGNSMLLLNEYSVSDYNSMLLVKFAMDGMTDVSATTIKTNLYYASIEAPTGTLRLGLSNYCVGICTMCEMHGALGAIVFHTNPTPIIPRPFYFINHEKNYYTSDNSLNGESRMVELDTIGILLLMDFNEKKTFIRYAMAQTIADISNYQANIKNKEVVVELDRCPTSRDRASGLLFDYHNRGFRIVAGGCDSTTRDLMRKAIETLDMILLYWGYNTGHDCSKNIFYLATSPSQEIIPTTLHYFQTVNKDSIVLYSTDPKYEIRVGILKSMFKDFEYDIKYEANVNHNDFQRNLYYHLLHFDIVCSDGCPILVLLDGENAETFLTIFHSYFIKRYTSSQEILLHFPIYMYDNSHTSYSLGDITKGVYVYSPYLRTYSEEDNTFHTNYETIANYTVPNYFDAVESESLLWLLDVLKDATSLDTADILKQVYITSRKTAIGTIVMDGSNSMSQSVFFGVVDEKGDIIYKTTVSNNWAGEPWRDSLNRFVDYNCDWKNNIGEKYTRNVLRYAVVISSIPQYKSDGVVFYQALYAAGSKINKEGGINGMVLNALVFCDGNDNLTAYSRFIDFFNRNTTFFYGGWTKEVRYGLNKAAIETNSMVFSPVNLKGEECYTNLFFTSLTYQSFFFFIPWIYQIAQGSMILLYSDSELSKGFAESFIREFAIYKVNLLLEYQLPLGNEDTDGIAELIKRESPDYALVLSFLEGPSKTALFRSFEKYEMRPPTYNIVGIFITEQDVLEIGSITDGHYYLSPYVETEDTKQAQEDMMDQIKSIFSYYEGSTPELVHGFTAIEIGASIANLIGSTNPDDLRNALYTIDTKTPIGDVRFSDNNMINNVVSFQQAKWVDHEFTKVSVYDSTLPIIPQQYGSAIFDDPIIECNMRNNSMVEYPSIKLGILVSLTGSLETTHTPLCFGIQSAVHELFNTGTVNDHFVIIQYGDYESNNNKIRETIARLYDVEKVAAIIGCTDIECKRIAQEEAKKRNKLFYYVSLSVGQECDYNTFYVGSVPNQFISRGFEFLITQNYPKYAYLIANNDDETMKLVDIITDASSGLFSLEKTFIISNENYLSVDIITDIYDKLKNGGIILTAVTIDQLKKFLEYYSNMKVDHEKYAVYDILCNVDEFESVLPSLRSNVYISGRYFYDIGNDYNKKFIQTTKHYVAYSEPTTIAEGAYLAAHFWAKAANVSHSFETDAVRKASYGLEVESGSGKVTMTDDNHITAAFFVARFSETGETYSTVYSKFDGETALPWSWNIESTFAKKCTFSDGPNGNFTDVNVRRVLLVASLTGSLSANSIGLVDAYQIAINEINIDGVASYTLKADIFDLQSDINECKSYIRQYIEIDKKNPLAVFVSAPIECLNYIIDYADTVESDMIVFNIETQEIGYCHDSVFVAVEHSSLYKEVISLIRNRFYDKILLLGDSSNNIVEYVNKEFNLYFSDVIWNGNMEWTSSGLSTQLDLLKSYVTAIEDGKGCICIFPSVEQYKLLIDTMDLLGMDYKNKYNIMVMDKGNLIRDSGYKGFEIVSSYMQEEKSPENMEFKTKMYERISTNNHISDIASRTYVSVILWSKAINSANSLDRVKIKPQLRKEKLQSPEGLVYFGANQYLARIMRIYYVNDDDTTTLVHDTRNAHLPDAYEIKVDNVKICDFNDLNIGEEGNLQPYAIAFVYSFTGANKRMEVPLFETVMTTLNLINNGGGLLGNYLTCEVRDAESSVEKYAEIMTDLVKNSKYTYVFGGCDAETLKEIGSIFDNTEKILFYTGYAYGDKSYSNVIILTPSLASLADAVSKRVLELSNSAYIVAATDSFSKQFDKLLLSRMTNLLISQNGHSDFYSDNPVKTANDIKLALKGSGYIVNAVYNVYENYILYNTLCEAGIVSPDYIIINVFLNQNLYKRLSNACIEGHIFINSYFEALGSIETNLLATIPYLSPLYNADFGIRVGDIKPTAATESAAIAQLIFKGIVVKVNSLDYNKVKEIYHYSIDTPSYSVEVGTNNYLKRRIFSGTIRDGTLIIDWGPDNYFTSTVYNKWDGKNLKQIDDWSDKDKGENYEQPTIILAFLHEKDIGGKTEQMSALVEDLAVKEINDQGGILNYQLFARHYWVIINDAYKTVRTIQEEGNTTAIFGCSTSECRNEVERYLSISTKDILFFFLGRDDGYLCSKRTITAGVSINQKVEPLVKYLTNVDLQYIYLIGPARNSTYIQFEVLKKASIAEGYTIVGEAAFSPFNTEFVDACLKDLESKVELYKRVGIFNLFIARENALFLEEYVKDAALGTTTSLFIFNYDPADISSSIKQSIDGSFIIAGYSDAVKNTASGAFKFTSTAEYQDAIDLSESLEVAYSTIYLWKSAVEYSTDYSGNGWPSTEYVSLSIKYISYDAPSGTLQIKNNNRAYRTMYLFRLSNQETMQIYPKQGVQYMVESQLTYISSSDCLFGKNRELYEYKPALQYVTYVLCGINGFLSLVTLIFVYMYRNTKIIKSASPLFLYYTIISIMLIAAIGIVFTLAPTTETICAARIWCLAISVDFLFSIMFSKAWRIHKLFNNKEMKRVKVSNLMLLRMIGVILGVQIVYLLIWTFVKPSTPTQTFSTGYSDYLSDVYLQECTENYVFIIIQLVAVFILFGWGTKLAWGVRNASAEFNESMTLMSTIGVIIVMGIIIVPLNFLMAGEPDTLLLIRTLGIELGVFAVLILQFGSKMMYLYVFEIGGTSTFSASLGSSNKSSSKDKSGASKVAKRNVARGRFTLTPHILTREPIEMATISCPDMFYIPPEAFPGSSSSVRRANSQSKHSVSVRRMSDKEGLKSAYSARNLN